MTHHQPVIDHDVEADNLLRVGEGTCVWEIDSGSRTGVGFITCSLFFLRSFLLVWSTGAGAPIQANILAAIYSELEIILIGLEIEPLDTYWETFCLNDCVEKLASEWFSVY
ncbi:unnamed protein product [Rhizophagus irregularis]|uniref:Uncharacterized protein n=1 Tax=Rhizophagus irregularis TaxID=588596 RepID=A0A915ZBV9_9GLOM|nr:unnamed protein product [Rhizophagus irregularis]